MNKAKKFFIILGVLVFALVGAYGSYSVIKSGKAKVSDTEPAAYSDYDKEKDSIYLVKTFQDGIGVYQNTINGYVLINLMDTNVDMLPEADIASLKEGIYLKNRQELIMLIEDFSD